MTLQLRETFLLSVMVRYMEVGEREGRQANSAALTTATLKPSSLLGWRQSGSLGRGTLLVASHCRRLLRWQSQRQGLE